jgi:hypothetical protein
MTAGSLSGSEHPENSGKSLFKSRLADLRKRLRQYDSKIGKIDRDYPLLLEFKSCLPSYRNILLKRQKLDQKRKETRQKLKDAGKIHNAK